MSEYVKFSCERLPGEIKSFAAFAELNAYRAKLLDLHVLGVDSNGIGFGNLSVRDGRTGNFYVTASGTGGKLELTPSDCAKVVACDFKTNAVRFLGSSIPSSESLTHAAIYASDPTAGAVIHCHDCSLWTALLNRAPTTSEAAEYGTPGLAYEIIALLKDSDAQNRKIVVLAGHESGIVTFGKDLDEAFAVLIRERNAQI
jgi:ribulose-5-phosphate 4-epimerase/fuculose-1-phosphate aldolase